MTHLRATILLLAACGQPMEPPDAGMDRDAGRLEEVDAGGFDGGVDAGDPRPLTTIRVHYSGMPGAITIRGAAPLSWSEGLPTVEESPGVHVLTTREISAPIEWKPLLGDQWSRGANYHVEPGDTIDVAPHFTASGGRVTMFAFDSDHIASPRTVWAYLPPGYDENDAATYPVVYMHDGQNLFEALEVANEWEIDETMGAAGESGWCPDLTTSCTNDGDCAGARCDSFHEAIVIGPENARAGRIGEYTPSADPDYGGGGADFYLRALIEDLKPMVDAMFRTRPGREDTAIAGSSLGGLVSAYAGVERPDVFGRVGAMSPSTWWDDRMILDVVATIPSRSSRALRVYVDSGNAGASMDGVAATAELARAYESVGYVEGADFHYVVADGHQHDEASWALRMPGVFTFLLGPREE